MEYLGHLPHGDPLYGYLQYDIQPALSARLDKVEYRVFKLNASNDVYLYEEKYSGSRCIGKFFHSVREPDYGTALRKLDREYHHLGFMRGCGFSGSPHYIARALGRNDSLNALLVVEYCNGELLSHVITDAIARQRDDILFSKLTALAYFLATFHNRTANGYRVDFQEALDYMNRLIDRLRRQTLVDDPAAGELYYLGDCWRQRHSMWEDCQVVVHGDATPENFLFGDGLHVTGFDLERLHRADRVFDTGRLAAELAHFFMLETGNRYRAEPFIGHFLWEYCCHFPDREQAFAAITRRVPFYMGVNFLRIARNHYLDWNYRRRLIQEARECLWSFAR